MAGDKQGWVDRALAQAVFRGWSRAARVAGTTDLPELRRQPASARKLKHKLDELIYVS